MAKILEIVSASVGYNQNTVLKDVNLEVNDKDFIGVIGPNGGGKSTLLKAILGLVPISSGTVQVYGENPGNKKTPVGYVPQFAALDKQFPITLLEVVLTGCLKRGLSPFCRFTTKDKELAYALLDRVGIRNLANRRISDLSGGEFQKMLIARALAVHPKLLLLDEPTASVDAVSRNQIYALLADLNKDMTIILVTHDLLAISSQVHKLACLNESLVYHGDPELTETIVNNLYGCPVDLIAHGVPHRVLKEHGEDTTK